MRRDGARPVDGSMKNDFFQLPVSSGRRLGAERPDPAAALWRGLVAFLVGLLALPTDFKGAARMVFAAFASLAVLARLKTGARTAGFKTV